MGPWSQVKITKRPEDERVSAKREDLRIVSDELWNRVAARRNDTEGRTLRFEHGRMHGRPPKRPTRNLLAGISKCGLCGGALCVECRADLRAGPPGSDDRYYYYMCCMRRHSGTCENNLRMAVDLLNEAVLRTIEEHALTPEAVEHVIQLTEADDVRDQKQALEREAQDVEKRMARVVQAIEAGGDAASLVKRLRQLEERQERGRGTCGVEATASRVLPASTGCSPVWR